MKTIGVIDEFKQNFVDYAYEVNSNRAFPDVRDGLKPGQRACLWAMYTKGYTSAKPHVKSAKVSGTVVADYWSHGDTAVYETFVRMSQPWVNNIAEVDFHGSNGNVIIGPEAAHQRYCMTGDSLIKTNLGTIPIEELKKYVNDDETLNDVYIYDYKNNKVPATKFFDCGEHPVLKVTLKNGINATVTYNHPFMSFDETGKMKWIEAKDLTTDNKLLVPMPVIKKEELGQADENTLRAKALGSLVSEGYLTTQNRIGISNQDIDLVTPVKEWFESLNPGLKAKINYREKGSTHEYCIASKEIFDLLENEYNYKRSAKDKVIPKQIFSDTLFNKAMFLSYLFEGDGCIAKLTEKRPFIQIHYSTYSETLVHQLQILLAQDFGISSTILSSQRKTGIEYKLVITSCAGLRFANLIDFVSDRKRILLKKACDNFKKPANNSYFQWNEINKIIHKKYPKTQKYNMGNFVNIAQRKELINEEDYNYFYKIMSNYLLVPVTSIEYLSEEKRVYSVRVDNLDSDHSYVANGLINHNTEVRLSRATEDGMFMGIKKNSVNMIPNFSEDKEWPEVLPAIFPRLLINGSQGIGM